MAVTTNIQAMDSLENLTFGSRGIRCRYACITDNVPCAKLILSPNGTMAQPASRNALIFTIKLVPCAHQGGATDLLLVCMLCKATQAAAIDLPNKPQLANRYSFSAWCAIEAHLPPSPICC